jgi:hypothetical protein
MQRWIALWLSSLAVVAGLTTALMRAQAQDAPPPFGGQGAPADGRIVSGQDLGFRVESINPRGEPVGTLLIRVNGQWVPARFTPDLRPAH